MTTVAEVVRAALPDANEELCDFILWCRTPFPAGAISAKSLYQAARRWGRAQDHNLRLCEMCDRLAEPGKDLCQNCDVALHIGRREQL